MKLNASYKIVTEHNHTTHMTLSRADDVWRCFWLDYKIQLDLMDVTHAYPRKSFFDISPWHISVPIIRSFIYNFEPWLIERWKMPIVYMEQILSILSRRLYEHVFTSLSTGKRNVLDLQVREVCWTTYWHCECGIKNNASYLPYSQKWPRSNVNSNDWLTLPHFLSL